LKYALQTHYTALSLLPSSLPTNPYFRFRVTRDAAFINVPTPLGEMVDGEVEDYRALVPTAANVSVSGRIVSAEGTPVANVKVVLTDAQGDSRTVTSSSFGYFSFEDLLKPVDTSSL
jgi:hypothetical protein